jgi:hypothetical protein
MATLATMVLLIVAVRLLHKYGAFEENGDTFSAMDRLHRLMNVTPGIYILSVLGSFGSEGKCCSLNTSYSTSTSSSSSSSSSSWIR